MSSDVSVCLSIKQQLYPLPPPGELTNGAPAPNKWLAAEMSKLGLILTLPHKLGPGLARADSQTASTLELSTGLREISVLGIGPLLETGTNIGKVWLLKILKAACRL